MVKRLLSLILCLVLVLGLSACAAAKPKDTSKANGPADVKVEKQTTYINNLTGLYEFTSKDKVKQRPVAVMINNASVAQPVQAGLNDADIIYETEVEGGVTRLLAVFKDIDAVGQLGTVRSARYPYIDLAIGHDAVYCHHGQDGTYAAPHLNDVNRIVIDTAGVYGRRIKNGISAIEHTLYGFGDKIWAGVKSKYRTTSEKGNWANFASPNETVTLSGVANTVNVPFSNYQKAKYVYDAAKGTYTRYSNGNIRTDYLSGKAVEIKNVFILLTPIYYYPDRVHKKVELSGGKGYYCVNGTFTEIRWVKGDAKDGFTFTTADGVPLKVNAGRSWVNIANSSSVTPTFE